MEAKVKNRKKDKRSKFVKLTFEICPTAYPYFIPVKAKPGSIGYDLVCPVDFHVPAHSRVAIPVNFAINLPFGVEAKIEARSGMTLNGMEGYGTRVKWGWKWGFIPWKTFKSGKLNFDADVMPGKIDPNFTDSINVILKNNDVAFTIKAGTRIAQMTFYSTMAPYFDVVSKLSCKSRGGGLGSSGTSAMSGAVRQRDSGSQDIPEYTGAPCSKEYREWGDYMARQKQSGRVGMPFSDWLEWRGLSKDGSAKPDQPGSQESDCDTESEHSADKK